MIAEEIDPVSYMIEVKDVSVHKHQVDHIHYREGTLVLPPA